MTATSCGTGSDRSIGTGAGRGAEVWADLGEDADRHAVRDDGRHEAEESLGMPRADMAQDTFHEA